MNNRLEINNIYELDVLDFLKALDEKVVDLAIIDPPYNMSKGGWDVFLNTEHYFDFTYSWLDALLPKMKSSGSIYLFNTPYNSSMILNYLNTREVFFKNWITWYKKDGFAYTKKRYINNQETILFYTMHSNNYTFNADEIRVPYLSTDRINAAKKKGILKNGKRWYPNENGRLCPDVWEITSHRHVSKKEGKVVKQNHPTPKPVEMIERMILASSDEGDLVLDLFSGTGTTSYVSKKLNRNFIGCENDPYYIELINKRLEEKNHEDKS